MFGGAMLAYLDEAAGAYVSQIYDTPRMVTVKIDECIFKKPAKEGQLIKIYGTTGKIGTTSIDLYLEARSHSVYSGKQSVVLCTKITFVRIDENGDPDFRPARRRGQGNQGRRGRSDQRGSDRRRS